MKNKTSLAVLFLLSSQNIHALDTIMKDSVEKSCNTQQSCQARDKCINLVRSLNPYIQPESK